MIDVFLIGMGLSMDALSVSLTNGMCMKNLNLKDAFKIAIFFGFFQFLMPVIGNLTAGIFKSYIESVDHWIAFVLLFFIGIKMIFEAVDKEQECKVLNFKNLMVQAIATSIDALVVGISFAALKTPIISASLLIGMITFILCFIGVYIGKVAGNILKSKAEIFGGIILIGIGIKILIEHLI